MATMMKAAVVRELGQPLVIDEVAVPEPGPGQILVRIAATGVCHTDLHAVRGDWPVKPQPPFIPGHEGVGVVAALGSGVRRVKEGDRVGVPWLHTACGYCQHCRTGWETLCGAQQNTGYSVNGSFGEYALAPTRTSSAACRKAGLGAGRARALRWCHRLQGPQGDRGEARRMGRHLGHRRSWPYGGAVRPRHGDARGRGRCSRRQARRWPRSWVPTSPINAREADPAGELQKRISGAHGVLVTAVSPTAFEQAFGMLRSRGTMSLVGLPPGQFAMPIFETVLKRLTVRGSIVGTRQDLEEALAFAGDGAVAAHFAWDELDNINDIFTRMEAGGIDGRIVLRMDEAAGDRVA